MDIDRVEHDAGFDDIAIPMGIQGAECAIHHTGLGIAAIHRRQYLGKAINIQGRKGESEILHGTTEDFAMDAAAQ